MSIVSVHGPNMWGGSGASTGGSGNVVETAQVRATADQSNGRKFTFEAVDKSRAAADYSWAFTPDGVPATKAADKGPVAVTFSSAGAKTATLTVAAGAGPPAGGAYPIVVQSLTAGPRMVEEGDGDGEEPQTESMQVEEDDDEGGSAPAGFDPAAHTVPEVEEYVIEHPDEAANVLELEEAGKARVTLISYLEALINAE